MSTTVTRETSYLYDTLLQLEDGAAAITASGAGSAILDIGDARMRGDVVIDVSAIDTVTGDETYTIHAQFSSSSSFASDIELGPSIQLSAAAVGGSDVVPDAGRYVLPVVNVLDTRQYQYMRLFVVVAGTTPSITFEAFLSKEKSL